MTRNPDNRVEAITPIEESSLRNCLDAVIESLLVDTENRWVHVVRWFLRARHRGWQAGVRGGRPREVYETHTGEQPGRHLALEDGGGRDW